MSRIHDALRKVDQHEPASSSDVWTNTIAVSEHSPSARTHHIATKEVAHGTTPADADILASARAVSWTFNRASMLDFEGGNPTRGNEEFRILRSRLYQVKSTQQLMTVVVTSALRGEGKSFVAANLWQALSLHPDRKVLLVDGDLRTPCLHNYLGSALEPGLSECLDSKVELREALQKGNRKNAYFIPAGNPWPRPSDLISDGGVAALVKRLVNWFDWIIIDAPAALETSDSSSLGEIADGVLMVVRANVTAGDLVQKALDRFDEDRLLGVVLNEIADAPAREQDVSGGGKYAE
jgi:capsular exopolysaccharide synthesis family protein